MDKWVYRFDEVDEAGAIARSMADAPDIDGIVRVVDGRELAPGHFADVLIEDADEYDLVARLAV